MSDTSRVTSYTNIPVWPGQGRACLEDRIRKAVDESNFYANHPNKEKVKEALILYANEIRKNNEITNFSINNDGSVAIRRGEYQNPIILQLDTDGRLTINLRKIEMPVHEYARAALYQIVEPRPSIINMINTVQSIKGVIK